LKFSRFRQLRNKDFFIIFVVVPTFLSMIYYSLIASGVYISESRFVIKSQAHRSSQISTLANFIQTTGLSSSQEQANELMDYIRSRDALADAQQHIDVHAIFSSKNADIFTRFPQFFQADTFENIYKYYGWAVGAHMDNDTGAAVLTVKAHSPKEAQALNEQLLKLSEDLINRLNQRAERRAIAEAETHVATAEKRVRFARIALREYRNNEDLLDPAKQATGVLELSNKLIGEQVALKAQLTLMQRVAPANPSIPALQSRIDAIGRQISMQNGRAVGTSVGIASKLTDYEKFIQEQEFAVQSMNAANAGLEQARVDAQKQQYYLERVVEPNKPDQEQLPHRLTQILTIAGILSCLYFIIWMLVVGIIEHSPED
jgi:capsular polysaccharide transport system permease protein